MEKERMFQIREKLKRKRPSFRRIESWRYKKLKDSWRKARGIDSQTRKKEKSGVKSPTVGYRSPRKVRGFHPSGYEEIRVFNLKDFKGLNNKKHAIKFSAKIGAKKRIALVDYAQSRGFKILNLGIAQRELEQFESLLQSPLKEMEDVDIDDLEESLDED